MNEEIEKILNEMEEDRMLQEYYEFYGNNIQYQIEKTNRRLDEIDILIDSGKLQPYQVQALIHEMNELECYYKQLEELNLKGVKYAKVL